MRKHLDRTRGSPVGWSMNSHAEMHRYIDGIGGPSQRARVSPRAGLGFIPPSIARHQHDSNRPDLASRDFLPTSAQAQISPPAALQTGPALVLPGPPSPGKRVTLLDEHDSLARATETRTSVELTSGKATASQRVYGMRLGDGDVSSVLGLRVGLNRINPIHGVKSKKTDRAYPTSALTPNHSVLGDRDGSSAILPGAFAHNHGVGPREPASAHPSPALTSNYSVVGARDRSPALAHDNAGKAAHTQQHMSTTAAYLAHGTASGHKVKPSDGRAQNLAERIEALRKAIAPTLLGNQAHDKQQFLENLSHVHEKLREMEAVSKTVERRHVGVDAGLIRALEPILQSWTREAMVAREPLKGKLHLTLELATDVLLYLGACEACADEMRRLGVNQQLERLRSEGGVGKVHASKVLWVVQDGPMLASSVRDVVSHVQRLKIFIERDGARNCHLQQSLETALEHDDPALEASLRAAVAWLSSALRLGPGDEQREQQQQQQQEIEALVAKVAAQESRAATLLREKQEAEQLFREGKRAWQALLEERDAMLKDAAAKSEARIRYAEDARLYAEASAASSSRAGGATLEQEHRKAQELQVQLVNEQREVHELQVQLEKQGKTVAGLQEQLEKEQKKAKELQAQLEALQVEHDMFASMITRQQEEVEELRDRSVAGGVAAGYEHEQSIADQIDGRNDVVLSSSMCLSVNGDASVFITPEELMEKTIWSEVAPTSSFNLHQALDASLHRLLKHLKRRWLKREQSIAFYSWHENSKRQARAERVCSRIILKLVHRCVDVAFCTWRENSHIQKRARSICSRIVMHWKHRAAAAAFESWAEHAKLQVQAERVCSRIILKLVHRCVDVAFCTWCETAERRATLRGALKRITERWRYRGVAVAMSSWRENSGRERYAEEVASRAVCRWQTQTIWAAFDAWLTLCFQQYRAVQELRLKTIKTLQNTSSWKTMKKAFASWHVNTDERVTTKKLLAFKKAGITLARSPPNAQAMGDVPLLHRSFNASDSVLGHAVAGLSVAISRGGAKYQENEQLFEIAMRLKVERDRALDAAEALRVRVSQ